ncbi:ABC transporter ATP-binding protein [Aquibacillus albus]|uniref:ATP-binding cassette subfamily B protein n=1 Tax=Aquibacillus albus TaxID=1168171 RepID=A0ABS2MXZ2_9BACI|nr:ABC transporter ATP-binding protein [Aquibacillus albus]MBM7570663.1 ATP-binding cassette subfamily B protein [Aquibacillus albus]
MKLLYQYARKYKKAMSIALALMVTELIVELVQPLVMAVIIDEGVVQRDMQTVMMWGSVLLLLTVVAFIAGIVSSFFAAEVSQGVGYDVRHNLFEHIQSFSALQMQRFSTPSLITRMTGDITQIQGLLFMLMRIALRAPLFIIFGIVMAFIIHVKLATILVAIVPVLLVIMYWIMTKGMSLFRTVQTKLDEVNRAIRENLHGIRLVKAYYRVRHEKSRFFQTNRSLMDITKKSLSLMEVTMPILMLGMNGSIVIILWFGYQEIGQGTAQPGEIVAILNYATRILGAFGVFSFLIMNFSRGTASASRIAEVLQSDVDEPIQSSKPESKDVKGKISFDSVYFSYPNTNANTLRDITFTADPGQVVGVLGETGSGKSTLLQLIPRLFPVTSGTIYIDQTNVNDQQGWFRDQIALVPQELHIFSGTIRENISWGNEEATMEEIIEAATDANIHSFIASLPDGYETVVGQRGVNLSGGQKQRISIARALVKNPRILLLDDSTSALDANTESRVLKALNRRSCTTVIVAQKISSVVDADKILLLQQGRVAGAGSHQQLLKNNELYQQIYYSQISEEVVNHVSKPRA